MKQSLLLSLSSLAVVSASISPQLLWSYYDPIDIFGSASVSLTKNTPNFAIASDFGSGFTGLANAKTAKNSFANEIYSTITNGCSTSECMMYVDQARTPQSAIDTFILVVGDNNCNIYGYESSTGKQAYNTVINNCTASEGIGASYRCWEASDDGSTIALMGYGYDAGLVNETARAYVIDGSNGKVTLTYDLKNKEAAGQGDITLTPDGKFIAFVNEDSVPTPNSAQLHVLDSTTGTLRAEVQIPFFIAATVSDSGNYVAIQNFTHLVGSEVWLLKWNGNTYNLATRIPAPSNFVDEFVIWDMQSTTLSTGEEVVAVGWISAPSVLELRVTIYNYATGALLTEYAAPISKQYQNNPTIRCFGDYVALALWGDNDDTPTTVLLTVGSNSTLFAYTSPGSMFSTDIVVDSSSSSNDVVYVVSAGKHVPANVMGSGGDAYAWQITVPK